ncbi:Diacylglycerol acyltransferase/mycolyltransferase Ag85A precursor [Corynebacterium ciconiae DSM 44920]|uniref:alpha/beta hydrolase n=1 Tax=Corynebacterium ciconiae TaxID=227319 RepID=UPI00037D7659|nr:alpha/beta hydrolase family protein [Corynebacterium ciconiae]WKD60265.1 Diacylglycerol acyltransferase/mycolyltransferase Ag85A precursor [Corynebacterium ciconiae DSM 44920]
MKFRFAAPLVAATIAAAGLIAPTVALPSAPVAQAAEAAQVHEGATPRLAKEPEWRAKVNSTPNMKEMWAFSPAMNRNVPLVVITPKDASAPRPTLYLLNGGDGGEGRANWIMQTDVAQFYADKNVNVVIPMEGRFSYYTDWVNADQPQLGGKQLWETFLTQELPTPLESQLGASGERGIAGMSMSATSSLLLAQHNPELYQAVGSFSGCAATNDPISDAMLRVTLNRAKSNPDDMWGPVGSDTRARHDAVAQAESLRGHEIYISNSAGPSGKPDMISNPRFANNPMTVANVQLVGGSIEAATNWCTHLLKAKMEKLEIPATFNMRDTGTHQWSYWQMDLRDSWPVFDRAWSTN